MFLLILNETCNFPRNRKNREWTRNNPGIIWFFVKFVRNRSKKMIYYDNRNKSWEKQDTYLLPLGRIWWIFTVVVSRLRNFIGKVLKKFSIFGTTSIYGNRDDTYCLLQKYTQEKTIFPIILNSQKINQELGDLIDSKNPKRENLF